MKTKIGFAIVALACLGLVIALVVVQHRADEQRTESASKIDDLSNQIVKASAQVEDLNQANLNLNSDLATNREFSLQLSNQLVEAAGTLANTAASLENAQQQITNLNEHVNDLEAQNRVLDDRANSLSNTITELDAQIKTTQLKLSESETNAAFLNRELKRQIAEKAEMQRRFNDLAEVRAQVKKLRDDLLIARRLEYMRQGIDPNNPMKGGQLLMQRELPVLSSAPTTPPPGYNLNVEVGSDGSIHVLSPPTNAPPSH